ncbi:MAG: hypothetical protein JXX29_15800 [Deltaproteobacteria bacterium]|nr:hypothetical protein [Deltaproteobacteria bacterium]MBN2673145.1 hypothetical protein [Deltaproteobacteria bacterium]
MITGFHRSGTSSLAHYMHDAGLNLGENLIAPDISNMKGYFEDWNAVRLHDSQLKRSFTSWRFHDECMLKCDLSAFAHYADMRFDAASQFGMKDPRASLFLPQWNHVLQDEGGYVFIVRHWSSCVESLLNRHSRQMVHQFSDHPEKEDSIVFWQRPTLAAEMWLSYNERILQHVRRYRSQSVLLTQRALFHNAPILDAMNSKFSLQLDSSVSKPFDSSLIRDVAYEEQQGLYSEFFFQRLESLWRALVSLADFRHGDEEPQWEPFPVRVPHKIADMVKSAVESSESHETQQAPALPMPPYDCSLSTDSKAAVAQIQRLRATDLDDLAQQQLLEQVENTHPVNTAVQLAMARYLIRVEKYQEAMTCIKRVATPENFRSNVNLLLGNCYAGLQDVTTAKMYFDRAVEDNPDNSMTFSRRAVFHSALGNFDAAQKDFIAAKNITLRQPSQLKWYADFLCETQQWKEAKAVAAERANIHPGFYTYSYLAGIEMREDYNQAKARLLYHLYQLHRHQNVGVWCARIVRTLGMAEAADDFMRRFEMHWQALVDAYHSMVSIKEKLQNIS